MASRRQLRLVFYPGIWILSFIVFWLGHFKFPTLIAGSIGLVTYFVTRWAYRNDPRPYLHPAVTVTLILTFSMLLPLVSTNVSWDPLDTAWIPTGIPSDYDAWNGDCGTRERNLSNGAGVVATLREVECTGAPIVPPSRDYFVFVRGAHQNVGRKTLVLAYREWADDEARGAWRLAPRIAWTSESALTIESGRPSIVPLERTCMDGVTVDHIIDKGLPLPDVYRFGSGNGWMSLEPAADFWFDSHW